jgi:hypothetical protein
VRVIGKMMRLDFQPNAEEREGFMGDLNAESGEDTIHHMMKMDGSRVEGRQFLQRGSCNPSIRFGR